jgi:hypothetical protein
MEITCSKSCDKLGHIAEQLFARDPNLDKALSGCELSIGPASDSKFGVPAAAQDCTFIGDAAWINGKIIDPVTEAMFQVDASRVEVRPVYNPQLNKWDMQFKALVGDDIDPIAGQLFSPWNISYMARIFKEPLAYSNVDKFVHYDSGSNPWAELYTLFMERYAGWAAIGQTGSLQNTLTNDVNVKDGMMSAPVINISGTYSLTLEEQVRQNGQGSPFGQSPMTRKQSYLNYAINMLKAHMAFYGNEETGTQGFLDVNPIQIHPAGKDLKSLWRSTDPAKGNKAYLMLAEMINDMLSLSMNKFDRLKIGMAPDALNLLRSMPYSDVYDPSSAMKIFLKNYDVKGKDGGAIDVEFVSEPFLAANTIFNQSSADLLLIDCPEIGAGPTDESQPTVIFGAPLQKFVFPAIPGQYNTQYKTLARLAGIIAPVPSAIRVIQGFGVQ